MNIIPKTKQLKLLLLLFSVNNTIQDMNETMVDYDNDEHMDCDSGAENLDLMVGLMDKHSELHSEIVKLCNSFVEDIGERMKNLTYSI